MAKASGTAPGNPSEGLTFDTVVELLTMLDSSELPTRIVYKDGPLRLEVERGGSAAAQPAAPVAAPSPTPATSEGVAAPVAAPAASQVAPAGTAPAAAPADAAGEPVLAPIAGVFYRAPGPDAPPFAEVGQRVAADDVIGIIEVMKLMNTVRAGVAGTVVEVCVGNAELVEFEQVLVRIDPADGA